MATLAPRAPVFFTVLVVMNMCKASGLIAATRSRDLPKSLIWRSKSSSFAATTRERSVRQSPEEFSVAADQALLNLSNQFSQFRNDLASRSTQLTEELRRKEHANHDVEDANARISKAIDGLKHDNQGLIQTAKTLTTQNEQLRGELRTLQIRLQAAEAFASSGVEGSSSSEAADLEAAEHPPPPPTPPPPQSPPAPPAVEAADNVASNAATMSATDEAGTAASSGGSIAGGGATQVESAQVEAAAPVAQTENDEGAGYADAFASGDDEDGSIVERPPSENEGPDDSMGDDEVYAPALLAVSAKRHRRSGRRAAATSKRLRRRQHARRHSHPAASAALSQIPSDLLPSTAAGFAKLEKNSVASLQHQFDSQLRRLHAKHDGLLQQQAALIATRQSVEKLHSRLAAAVTQLEARHNRLQHRARSVAAFLEPLAAVAQGPENKAATALRALPAAPLAGLIDNLFAAK
mmetsp:Transcript_69492/g.137429  ORF Transcript_69492/g.137429 Transcript_69492/m.137429 type:complete len:465 (-) Transcript_69492:167-1561(-)